MALLLPRRAFLHGLGSLLAAPAIVHVQNIMPVKALVGLSRPPFIILDLADPSQLRPLAYSFKQVEEIYAANVLNQLKWRDVTSEV